MDVLFDGDFIVHTLSPLGFFFLVNTEVRWMKTKQNRLGPNKQDIRKLYLYFTLAVFYRTFSCF